VGALPPCAVRRQFRRIAGRAEGVHFGGVVDRWRVDVFHGEVNGASHVWRQRFPNGALEQLTFGPAEEAGLAMSADGRSIVTSVGIFESGAWMHDHAGDHLISPEGYAAAPSFSHDGGRLYYLLRRKSGNGSNDLWKTDVASGKSEAIVTGFAVNSYDVSPDGRQVVFSAPAAPCSR
jgi:Tol biopolymer transport system component